jgi:hypothetical protein
MEPESHNYGVDTHADNASTTVTIYDTYRGTYLSEVLSLREEGLLEAATPLCLRLFSTLPTLYKDAWYHLRILEVHLASVTAVDPDDINSLVCRSIEYGAADKLAVILAQLPHLRSIATGPMENTLLLRKADATCYVIASTAGFCDTQLEAGIILLQRLWRYKRGINEPVQKYAGPHPEAYQAQNRYWGYRHTQYYCRWNRHHRYRILRRLMGEWWGNCSYDGYNDLVEGGREDFLMPRPS